MLKYSQETFTASSFSFFMTWVFYRMTHNDELVILGVNLLVTLK